MKTLSLCLCLLSLPTLSACSSSATLVRKDNLGGRIALAGAYMPAMADARLLMAEHCDGRFVASEQHDHVEFQCVTPASHDASPIVAARADGLRRPL